MLSQVMAKMVASGHKVSLSGHQLPSRPFWSQGGCSKCTQNACYQNGCVRSVSICFEVSKRLFEVSKHSCEVSKHCFGCKVACDCGFFGLKWLLVVTSRGVTGGLTPRGGDIAQLVRALGM